MIYESKDRTDIVPEIVSGLYDAKHDDCCSTKLSIAIDVYKHWMDVAQEIETPRQHAEIVQAVEGFFDEEINTLYLRNVAQDYLLKHWQQSINTLVVNQAVDEIDMLPSDSPVRKGMSIAGIVFKSEAALKDVAPEHQAELLSSVEEAIDGLDEPSLIPVRAAVYSSPVWSSMQGWDDVKGWVRDEDREERPEGRMHGFVSEVAEIGLPG